MNTEQTPQNIELDPVTRALAEARAREAGKSVSDYLAELLLTPQGSSLLPLLPGGHYTPEYLSHGTPKAGAIGQYFPETSRDVSERPDVDHWTGLISQMPPPWLTSVSISPALNQVFVFNYRIRSAELLMSAAFLEAAVSDFHFSIHPVPSTRRRRKVKSNWYRGVIYDVLDSSKQLRDALVHKWTPTPRAEQLAVDAFILLSDLTPSRTELLQLCRYDRHQAFSELAKHIDLAAEQFRLSTDLLEEIEGGSRVPALPAEARFSDLRRSLLRRGGEGLSLTDAASLLGMTRQALHKRVKLGTALGLMDGTELTLPRFQFIKTDKQSKILDGIGKVVKLFDTAKAGRWSALQFLVEKDPNLGEVPRYALEKGRVQDVVDAAIAYLSEDEG